MGGKFYENIVTIQKKITVNQAKNCFGVDGGDSVGKLAFCAIECTPSFASTFPMMLKGDELCLIPCAIDQDPYFRITRDVAARLKWPKPSIIHSKFLPAMTGNNSKMSSSEMAHMTIFLDDTLEMIETKIKKYAFSGGQATLKEHRKLGADLDVDVSYQYLTFFLDDDVELARIKEEYGKGTMTTGEVKSILIKVLQDLIVKHQNKRQKVTNVMVDLFMSPRKLEAIPLADH
jgi:tryptophanyl-tRNA synthetase